MITRTWRRTAVAVAFVGAAFLAACHGNGRADDGHRHVIAGGDSTGVYYNYSRYLAAAMSEELGATITAVESNGSIENIHQVADGEALLGFAQGDTTADAVGGVGAFDEALPIDAVARVYDEYVHVVVATESAIEDFQDLRDRRVSLGAKRSGTEVVARRLLAAADIDIADIDATTLGIDASIEAFQQGEIEAFVWVGGLPTPGISSLMDEMSVRLIPVDSLVDIMNAAHGGAYRRAVVPNGVYGTAEGTKTVAVPNYLITSADSPEDVIYDSLEVLFDTRTDIARHVPAAGLLDRRQAIFTEPVEMHRGAERYFRDTKR